MWAQVAVGGSVVGGAVYAAVDSSTSLGTVGTVVAIAETSLFTVLYLMGRIHPNSAVKAKDDEIVRLRNEATADQARHRDEMTRERDQHRADVTSANEKLFATLSGIGEVSVKAVQTNSLMFERFDPLLREALTNLARGATGGGGH